MAHFLNRFTSLPVLLDTLIKRRLTLLSPKLWEDRNDAYYLDIYKERRELKTVTAMCFSIKRETFHHWKVFSSGSSGVCIEFDKQKLLAHLDEQPGFRAELVRYKTLEQIKRDVPKLRDLPFLKRWAFADEGEFRILYRTKEVAKETKELPIELTSITKITLSPWMPESVAKSVIIAIRQIKGCRNISINRSTLVENSTWKAAIAAAKPSVTALELL